VLSEQREAIIYLCPFFIPVANLAKSRTSLTRFTITKCKSVVAVSVPSGAPQDVRAEPQSSTELLVMWEPPARDKWNGNILGYYVGFRPATDSQVPSPAPGGFSFKTVEAGSGGRVVLPGLARFSSYHVVVQAYNSKGAGPASEPVMARTMEDGKGTTVV
jgi:hypothetical protein